jgi:hypothetical protein
MGHASKERERLVGTRSADYIRASGHSGRIQRPYTWLHPTCSLKCQSFLLHRGRRPYMGPQRRGPVLELSVAMRVLRTWTVARRQPAWTRLTRLGLGVCIAAVETKLIFADREKRF